MASYNKNNAWAERQVEDANLGSDQFVIYLTANGSAPVATNSVLGDVTEVSYTNLSTRNITTSSSSQSSGTYKLVLTDLVLTASGAVATFRWVFIYNDTATNDELICYGKATRDLDNIIVVVVNLDCYHVQSGWVELPLQDLGLDPEHPYQMHDLLSDARYLWHGARNFVQLDPGRSPAHIFRLRRRVHNERDFDYFL